MLWFFLYLLSFQHHKGLTPMPAYVGSPTVIQRAGPGVMPGACRIIEVKGAMVTSVCP